MRAICLLSIYLIPFTSLPVLPTTYRPITALLLLIPGLIYVFRLVSLKKDKTFDVILLLFVGYITVYSYIVFLHNSTPVFPLLRNLIVIYIGVLMYFGFNFLFSFLSRQDFFKALRYMVSLFLFFSIIDVFVFFLDGNGELRSALMHFIAGKSTSRLQYTTSEAAWASQILLFLIPIQYWIYQKTNNSKYEKRRLILLYMLLIMTFSMLGYILLFVYTLIVQFYSNKNKLKFVRVSLLFLIVTLFVSVVIFHLVRDRGGYYIVRIESLMTNAKITDIYDIDASTYIRTIYPKVGIDMVAQNPLGLGVGGYSQFFGQYIVEYDYEMLYNPETQSDIRNKNADPKNFYAKVLSEFGIINSILFIVIIYGIVTMSAGTVHDRYSKRLLFSLSLSVLLVFLQFSSFAYVPFWFTVSLLKNKEKLDFKIIDQ